MHECVFCCSWNLPNPTDYALQFNSPSNHGFVTERVSHSVMMEMFTVVAVGEAGINIPNVVFK